MVARLRPFARAGGPSGSKASLDAAVPGTGVIMDSGNPPHVTASITGPGTGSVTPG